VRTDLLVSGREPGDIASSLSVSSGWLPDTATIACDPVVFMASTVDLCEIRARLQPGA
jgi:hypothetical protein